MGIGIQICGLNGSGKSTLGRVLAAEMGIHFIDNENLFFPGRDAGGAYENPVSRKEAERLLMEEVRQHPDFVFAAVRGDYGAEILPLYDYVVRMEVPGELRSQRVRSRSFGKFGNRMLEGGDLYEQEEAFFRMADARREDEVEQWLHTLRCPILRVDGTMPPEENARYILHRICREES